jgi:hypothetical protein
MKKIFFALFIMSSFVSYAQEKKEEPKYGISFSGFLKNDFFYDSRDNITIREGHFLLFPKEKSLDFDNKDINAKSSFNFLSIQSRLTGKITAPDAFGAKTSSVLEADFFGNENAGFVDANGFRLRHAYVKLNWAKTELLAGQYWHPFFIPGCFSGVISFNTGAPMQPFSRNPQIRLTRKLGDLNISGVLSAQRDFTSPQGSASLRYSNVPDISAIFTYEKKNEEKKTEILSGFAIDYKSLQPFLTTTKGSNTFVTDEKVTGLSATAFFKLKTQDFTFKLQGIYGQNLFDLTMLGGYVINAITDTNKNKVSYSTLNNFAGWAEVHTNGKNIQFGLWAGITQNLGSIDSIIAYSNKVGGSDVTTRGANIKSIIRIAPRLVFIQGKLNFATELEFTSAAYATKEANGSLNRDKYGVITKTENISNVRLLFSLIYNF